ncbi:MAG: hypothetical protein M3142_05615, partial [Bacteroidota bacterium]|nr:hypothetical protein [Bacteroidota bacterium]
MNQNIHLSKERLNQWFLSCLVIHFLKLYFPLFWVLPAAIFLSLTIKASAQDILTGLTSSGGAQNGGTVFTIKSTGAGFSVKKNFALMGYSPHGDLTKGPDGSFYGMTFDHYEGQDVINHGTIFKVTPAGKVTVLHRFDLSKDGGSPYGSLLLATDGNFYGMTSTGGPGLWGTIFKITPSGIFTVLHSFDYYKEGAAPFGNLVQGKDGNFYGMTSEGGLNNLNGDTFGTVFKITPSGLFTVLYNFNYNYSGGNPYGSLTLGKDGNFYGMTSYGGSRPFPFEKGTVFKITPTGILTVLYDLHFDITGAEVYGSLTLGKDGNFYAMTQYGSSGYGAV